MGIALCREIPVRYYLLTERRELCAYGICVEYQEEMVEISHITPSRQRIMALLRLLMNGCVTPVAVRDVVEDWLSA